MKGTERCRRDRMIFKWVIQHGWGNPLAGAQGKYGKIISKWRMFQPWMAIRMKLLVEGFTCSLRTQNARRPNSHLLAGHIAPVPLGAAWLSLQDYYPPWYARNYRKPCEKTLILYHWFVAAVKKFWTTTNYCYPYPRNCSSNASRKYRIPEQIVLCWI